MYDDIIDGDSICCVLASRRNVAMIYLVLHYYICGYEKLPGDYCASLRAPDDLTFADEATMLSYYVQQQAMPATFFWNDFSPANAARLMVGASLTTDGGLVMSLTMPVTTSGRMEEAYLRELKNLTQSDTGLIYSNQYPVFETAADFRTLCGQ